MANILNLLQAISSRYRGANRPNSSAGPASRLPDSSRGSTRPAVDAVHARAVIDAITAANRKPIPRHSRDPRELARIIRILMNMPRNSRGGAPIDPGMMRRYGRGAMSGGVGRLRGR
jgi:hypothetical protein